MEWTMKKVSKLNVGPWYHLLIDQKTNLTETS